MDLVAAADAVTADLGEYRLVHHAHHRRQREQAPHVRAADVRRAARLVADVSARAECLVAGAGQDDDADFRIIGRSLHRMRELFVGQRPYRISFLRPIDGDRRDAILVVIDDVLILQGRSSSAVGSRTAGVPVSFGSRVMKCVSGLTLHAECGRCQIPARVSTNETSS